MPNIAAEPRAVGTSGHENRGDSSQGVKPVLVHVAMAVIERNIPQPGSSPLRQILISKRARDVHQGGLWEFPGGKVESGESVMQALARELSEELGIEISSITDESGSLLNSVVHPLIQVQHDYGDKHVLLDVFAVKSFRGEAIGKEGQAIKWVNENELPCYTFPEANVPVLAACRLPRHYAITPEYMSVKRSLAGVGKLLGQSVELFLFRQPQLDERQYRQRVNEIFAKHPDAQKKMLLSGDPETLHDLPGAGIHAPFRYIKALNTRPVCKSRLFGVSCHSESEILQARKLGADFITLSPVSFTSSHPDTPAMGWEKFERLVRQTNIPVYALGGMTKESYSQAVQAGAQGIAGIRLFSV